VLGLRERKKAKTKAAIQEHALRLFREQGYAETTVEQIAAAAEVSPSTFFRYFPAKEDTVLTDLIDRQTFEVMINAPAEMTPLEALRYAVNDVFGTCPTSTSSWRWSATTSSAPSPSCAAAC
jgi:AcrR family transcriptional regulator